MINGAVWEAGHKERGEVCVTGRRVRARRDGHRPALQSLLRPPSVLALAYPTVGYPAFWDFSCWLSQWGLRAGSSSPERGLLAEHTAPKTKRGASQMASFQILLCKILELLLEVPRRGSTAARMSPLSLSLELGCLSGSPCQGHLPHLYQRNPPTPISILGPGSGGNR